MYDAIDHEGRKVEIKTRTKFWMKKDSWAMILPTHTLHKFEHVHLLLYYIDADKNPRIGYLRTFTNKQLERFKYEIVVPPNFWKEWVEKGDFKVPEDQDRLQKEEWQKVRKLFV